MPLHLLGKKSWNVYNHDNIEKVKRDEAAARAKEEAEEQRMQEIDAERRIQILRGEEPTPLPEIENAPDDGGRKRRSNESVSERKRVRRGYGENETDWQMRLAQEQSRSSHTDRQVVLLKPSNADAPLVGHSGHIDLFPQEHKRVSVEKNEEAEKEKKKKERELEDQYTMRFSNAAGFKQGLDNPWYSKAGPARDVEEPVSKDVWGNEDPRRKEREAARIVSNDPLAAMRQGAAKVRQVERERKRWREEKENEMRELEKAEEQRKRTKRRYDEYDDEDDLEDFRLDRSKRASPRNRGDDCDRERGHRHKESRRSSHRDEGHRHKHRDEERRHRHRHRHRHRERD